MKKWLRNTIIKILIIKFCMTPTQISQIRSFENLQVYLPICNHSKFIFDLPLHKKWINCLFCVTLVIRQLQTQITKRYYLSLTHWVNLQPRVIWERNFKWEIAYILAYEYVYGWSSQILIVVRVFSPLWAVPFLKVGDPGLQRSFWGGNPISNI